MYYIAESVCKGHPDKVCDQIVDSILDTIYEEYPDTDVKLNCMMTYDNIIVSGVLPKDSDDISIRDIVSRVLVDCGYNSDEFGVDLDISYVPYDHITLSLGDRSGRGIGYAIRETDEYMPYAIMLAHDICRNLDSINSVLTKLCPSYGKVQIIAEYDEDDKFIQISDIYVKRLFVPCSDAEAIALIKGCIRKSASNLDIDLCHTNIEIIPIYELSKDSMLGMNGRKITVDMYGDYISHTGGAFSGKDPKQFDRLLNYYARYIAKYIMHVDEDVNNLVIDVFYKDGKYRVYDGDVEITTNIDLFEFYSKIADVYFAPTARYGAFGYPQYPWEDVYAED